MKKGGFYCMKDKMKGLILGLTIGTMLSGTAAWAAGTQIEVTYRNLKYMFDGIEQAPSEGKGFIYEGTTYVPARFISESLGKKVEWDETNDTIWIGENPNHIVASYQGGSVTQKQFNTYMAISQHLNPAYASYENNADFRVFVLKQLLKDMILSSRASEANQAEAKVKAAQQITQMKTQKGEQFTSDLQALKLTEADLNLYITRWFTANNYLLSSITEDQIKAKFQANLAQDSDVYTTASVRHILIGLNDEQGKPMRTKEEALQKAKEVLNKLNDGGDFTVLAKEYSDDPGSQDQGGLYADADVSQWVPEFKKAAVELPIGTLSDPVETRFGYHILKVESRTVKTLDQVKNTLQNELATLAMQTFIDKELPALITKIDLDK
jgi:foldase protein PrsA